MTYAAGHTLVNTNNEMLFNDSAGLEGPNVWVIVNPTSRDMYVVAAKNAAAKKDRG